MSKSRWTFVFCAALLLGTTGQVCPQSRPAADATPEAPLDVEHAARASLFIDALDRGDWSSAHAMFDSRARAALPAGQLARIWTALPAQLGGAGERGPARGILFAGARMVAFRIAYPMAALEARIGVDAKGAIHTFRIVPASPEATPPPAHDEPFVETGFEVAGLPGTITLPRGAGPFPAVVLVHGSGPQDRDASTGPNKPFLDLARGLASRGVAVLRYDKRSAARPQDFADQFTVDLETVDDAVAAIGALRTTPGVDPARVFVAGHSLGAMMAPRIAQRAEGLAGVVLLAAPARSLIDVVPGQLRYLAALEDGVSAEEQAQIDLVDAQAATTRALGESDEPSTRLLLGVPAAYWRDLAGYDPVEVQATLGIPVLALQGGRDYQVTPADDFSRWQQRLGSDPRAELRLFPTLNHLFIAGEGVPGPQEYLRAGTVDPSVITAIADWIGRTSAR